MPKKPPAKFELLMPSFETTGVDPDDLRGPRIAGKGFYFIPPRIPAEVHWDGYEVLIEVSIGPDLEVTVTDLRIRVDAPDAEPITPETLRRLPLAEIRARVVDEGIGPSLIETGQPKPSVMLIRRGRKPDTATMNAEAVSAGRYYEEAVREGDRTPVEYVADHLGVSRRTAQRRIAAARQRGLIKGER